MTWGIVYTKAAVSDIPKLKAAHLAEKAQRLIALLAADPFQNPPPYEKLRGNLKGAYARRINIRHRLVYEVIETARTVKILSLWTHYGD
ncbi:MAG: Txe/YoeB family addiction module toxin [Schwartzia sp. (in: firmicutes)]